MSFDHYARLVKRFLDVPVALVTLVEAERQIFPGMVGLSEPERTTREMPIARSICQYVVMDDRPLVIADARLDPRLASNLAITEDGVVSYAGWPLVDATGRTVGSLCAVDYTVRVWSSDHVAILEDLALACSSELQTKLLQDQDSEILARTILESVNVAIAFYDTNDHLVMANTRADRAAEAAGFRLDQPPYAGVDVRRADNQSPVPLDEQIIPLALRGELQDHEMEWIGPPGNQIAIVASSRRVSHADGTPWGTLVAAHDVTELARSLQVKDEFITTVSHELRTPLTSILGYLELVSDEIGPDEDFVAKSLEKIERNAKRLLQRVEQLLDTADRRRQLTFACVDVASLAQRVWETFGQEARTAGITLNVSAAGPHRATIDAGQVEQALENLVSNSLQYTPPGGSVTILVQGRDQSVQLAVTDNGIGMSADDIAQACDTFWRSEVVQRAAHPGIGIGLSLVRDIVEAHQGSVDITSALDRGTTVTLTLPCDGRGIEAAGRRTLLRSSG